MKRTISLFFVMEFRYTYVNLYKLLYCNTCYSGKSLFLSFRLLKIPYHHNSPECRILYEILIRDRFTYNVSAIMPEFSNSIKVSNLLFTKTFFLKCTKFTTIAQFESRSWHFLEIVLSFFIKLICTCLNASKFYYYAILFYYISNFIIMRNVKERRCKLFVKEKNDFLYVHVSFVLVIEI